VLGDHLSADGVVVAQPCITYQATLATTTMKIPSSTFVFLVAVLASASAFAPSQNRGPINTALQATSSNKSIWWSSAVAAAAVGFTLATSQMAGAAPVNEQMASFQGESAPTLMLAASETIDFSLPSYNPNMGGFGDGTEAKLSEAKGGDEAAKQREAMLKAEEARKARLVQKKEEAKAREAEEKARAQQRKEASKDRFKEIFQ
jgi:hypothetical protein